MSEVQNGTRSAEPIRASGYVRRVNRPDTRPLLTRNPSQKSLAMQEPSTQDIAAVHPRPADDHFLRMLLKNSLNQRGKASDQNFILPMVDFDPLMGAL